jgi:aminoglycoside phosphotransferase (APT) family kinase protein
VTPLYRKGTFHDLYEICDVDNNKFILKITSCGALYGETLEKEQLLNQVLKKHKLPTLDFSIYGKTSKFHYLIMSHVSSIVDSHQFDDNSRLKNLDEVAALSKIIASVHSIKSKKYGPLNHKKLKHLSVEGIFEHWEDYLNTNLSSHLDYCYHKNYLTRSQYNKSLRMFELMHEFIPSFEPSLLHGDLNKSNFIFGEPSSYLLDWEDALSGDPLFDLALWGTFLGNDKRRDYFLQKYYQTNRQCSNIEMGYWLYYYRIMLAKTVHRHRFGYYKDDKIPPSIRLSEPLKKLEVLGCYS